MTNNNLKTQTTAQLEARAASLRKTVGNPFASRDMEKIAYRELRPIEKELARRA